MADSRARVLSELSHSGREIKTQSRNWRIGQEIQIARINAQVSAGGKRYFPRDSFIVVHVRRPITVRIAYIPPERSDRRRTVNKIRNRRIYRATKSVDENLPELRKRRVERSGRVHWRSAMPPSPVLRPLLELRRPLESVAGPDEL